METTPSGNVYPLPDRRQPRVTPSTASEDRRHVTGDRRKAKRYGVVGSHLQYRKGGVLSFLNHYSQKYLVLNIGELGLSFIAREPLQVGGTVTLFISAPLLPQPIKATGCIAWTNKASEMDAYRVGIAFTCLRGKNRSLLKNLIDNALLDSIRMETRIYFKESEKL